jgi:hypothetical protein
MCCLIGALIAGTIAGSATSPRALGDPARLRPAFRGLVKRGIIAKRKIQSAGTAVAQEAQKIVDEARLELDRAEAEQES